MRSNFKCIKNSDKSLITSFPQNYKVCAQIVNAETVLRERGF